MRLTFPRWVACRRYLGRHDAVECGAAPWCVPEVPTENRKVLSGVDQGPALHQLVSCGSLWEWVPTEWKRTVVAVGVSILAALHHSASAAVPEVIESFIARASVKQPRQTEADIVVLRDGTLFAAWSDFYEQAADNAPARISAAKSTDGGRTWGPRFTLQENTGKANVMSVSLVRSRSGDLLFFYLQKNSLTDLKAYVRRSTDDAKSWGAATLVTPEEGYHVMNNARVIQLRSGRLLAPIATTARVWTKNDNFKGS